jgi:hypothetical protein
VDGFEDVVEQAARGARLENDGHALRFDLHRAEAA